MKRTVPPLFWILFATVGVFVLANMPLIYNAYRFGPTTFFSLWKFAPHQFVFSLILVPGAVFLSGCGLWWTLRIAAAVKIGESTARFGFVFAGWPAIFLFGFGSAAIIAGLFFSSTTWSPDKLRTNYANEAVQTISDIQHEQSLLPQTKKALDAFETQKSNATANVASLKLTPDSVQSKLPAMNNFARAQVLLTKNSQTRLGLLDGAATGLSAFQVLAVVAVAAVLLITVGLLWILGTSGVSGIATSELRNARVAVFCAIACFVPYPFFFGVYKAELSQLVKVAGTGGQEVIAAVAIAAAFAIWLTSASANGIGVGGGIAAIVAVLITVAGAVSPSLGSGDWIRASFGTTSNIAIQITFGAITLVTIIAAAIYVAPRK